VTANKAPLAPTYCWSKCSGL